MNAEVTWEFPSISNPQGLAYRLTMTDGPAWIDWSASKKRFSFDLTKEDGVEVGDTFEVWMDFGLEVQDHTGAYFGAPSANPDAKSFN